MTDHQHHVRDLVAAYVLGAATPIEVTLVEEHLTTCEACRHLADELREVEALLPALAGEMTPSLALKARLMSVVEAEARAATRPAAEVRALAPARAAPHLVSRQPAQAGAAPRAGLPRRGARRLAPLLALAAMVALVVLGLQVWRLSGGTQPRPTSEYAVSGTATQPAIAGSVRYYAAGGRVDLDVHGLKQIPVGRVYEVWLIRGHYRVVTGIGTFRPTARGTGRLAATGERVPSYTLLCLTVEQAPRAARPTMPLVAIAPING